MILSISYSSSWFYLLDRNYLNPMISSNRQQLALFSFSRWPPSTKTLVLKRHRVCWFKGQWHVKPVTTCSYHFVVVYLILLIFYYLARCREWCRYHMSVFGSDSSFDGRSIYQLPEFCDGKSPAISGNIGGGSSTWVYHYRIPQILSSFVGRAAYPSCSPKWPVQRPAVGMALPLPL